LVAAPLPLAREAARAAAGSSGRRSLAPRNAWGVACHLAGGSAGRRSSSGGARASPVTPAATARPGSRPGGRVVPAAGGVVAARIRRLAVGVGLAFRLEAQGGVGDAEHVLDGRDV